MALNDTFRQYLEAADIDGVRRLWEHVNPHLPVPIKDRDVLVAIHIARTQMVSIEFRLRAYSHRWLVDHGYPSMMPDELKPKAERIYPRIADAVGISINSRDPLLKPVAKSIEKAMAAAVAEVYADGRGADTALVQERMKAAADRERRYFAELLYRPR